MKKIYSIIITSIICLLLLPLFIFWLPVSFFETIFPSKLNSGSFISDLVVSFKGLSITLLVTMCFSTILSLIIGYISVYSVTFGRILKNILNSFESIPAILIALFCYAPVSGILAREGHNTSVVLSFSVFVIAATVTVLPEAVRSISIPLSDLYDRKYSISFRSYGFSKNKILLMLLNTQIMRNNISQVIANILLKTLVLDTSFGYIIQVGLGVTGTPQHTSPGALIAANRGALLFGGNLNPANFWIPTILLMSVSLGFVLMLRRTVEN
ncbi:MAG: hypothetical protein SPG48_10235 [Treponema sp.]|nr:hypothetical protein [Treponema sp.]